MVRTVILSIFLLFPLLIKSQDSSFYKINIPIEGGLSLAGYAGTSMLFPRLYHVSTLRENDVMQLDRNQVNAFDRPVINVNPEGYRRGRKISDVWMSVSMFAPFALLIDDQIRTGWKEYLTLYLETQMINTSIYQIGAFAVRRPRPLTYNQTLEPGERTGEQRSNSFYSGHVSTSATATFFMTKVYTDMHRIRGWKRILLYVGASVPPAVVGYYRVQAGKHFKTDILVGFLTGAITGILIPELHKRIKGKR